MSEQLDRVDVPVEARLAERDANLALRDRHLERADADAGFENRRCVAAAADPHERIGPFADSAAGAREIDGCLDEPAIGIICDGALEHLARFRHGRLVAPRAPFFNRLDPFFFLEHLPGVIGVRFGWRRESDFTGECIDADLYDLAGLDSAVTLGQLAGQLAADY